MREVKSRSARRRSIDFLQFRSLLLCSDSLLHTRKFDLNAQTRSSDNPAVNSFKYPVDSQYAKNVELPVSSNSNLPPNRYYKASKAIKLLVCASLHRSNSSSAIPHADATVLRLRRSVSEIDTPYNKPTLCIIGGSLFSGVKYRGASIPINLFFCVYNTR